MEFCECGSMMIGGKCTNEHCRGKSQKCKAWVVGGRALKFKKPVTFEEADIFAKKMNNGQKVYKKSTNPTK